MTWADPKRRKENMYSPRLNDYEDERWRALCLLKGEQPNSLAREAMLAYLEHCESAEHESNHAVTSKRNQCA